MTGSRSRRARAKKSRVNVAFRCCSALRVVLGVVAEARTVQRIALCIVFEGRGPVPVVLAGLAEREVQVQAIHVVERGIRGLRFHGRDLRRLEAEGLEIGEAPVRLAERRLEGDAAAVGVDARPAACPSVLSVWP